MYIPTASLFPSLTLKTNLAAFVNYLPVLYLEMRISRQLVHNSFPVHALLPPPASWEHLVKPFHNGEKNK